MVYVTGLFFYINVKFVQKH